MKSIRSFAVELPLWVEFLKICKREKESASQKLTTYIARYVAVHELGNPQLFLERWTKTTEQTCFNCQGIFPNLLKVRFISGLEALICPECLKDKQKHRLIKRILKV